MKQITLNMSHGDLKDIITNAMHLGIRNHYTVEQTWKSSYSPCNSPK